MLSTIASVFVDARRRDAVLSGYPGDIPAALEDAYRIQEAAITLFGKNVRGWKVGRIPGVNADKYGSNRLAGPIFEGTIESASGGEAVRVPILKGFAAVEAELMLRVGETPPVNISLEEARSYVDEVRFGLEIASSPFPEINDHGPAVTVSDFGNNFGLVLGPKIDNWRSRDLLEADVTLAIDGEQVGKARLSQMLDGPFGAFSFLASALPKRGQELKPGQWISTGAITGVHRIQPGQRADARFDGEFDVSCITTEYQVNGNGAGA